MYMVTYPLTSEVGTNKMLYVSADTLFRKSKLVVIGILRYQSKVLSMASFCSLLHSRLPNDRYRSKVESDPQIGCWLLGTSLRDISEDKLHNTILTTEEESDD